MLYLVKLETVDRVHCTAPEIFLSRSASNARFLRAPLDTGNGPDNTCGALFRLYSLPLLARQFSPSLSQVKTVTGCGEYFV